MTIRQLTRPADPFKIAPMQGIGIERSVKMAAAMSLAAAGLAGCVTVNAPAEPIVIELNVNIRQEVIYRLAEDAGKTIEENSDIF